MGAAAPLLVVVPLAFGFGLLAAIFAFGHLSGGHFNPAVTVAMVIDGRTTPADAVGYIVAQVIGAIGAAGLVLVLWSQAAVAATITAPGNGFSDIQALILETVLTAGFLLVILSVHEARLHACRARDPARPWWPSTSLPCRSRAPRSTRSGASHRRCSAATSRSSGSTSSGRSSARSSPPSIYRAANAETATSAA